MLAFPPFVHSAPLLRV